MLSRSTLRHARTRTIRADRVRRFAPLALGLACRHRRRDADGRDRRSPPYAAETGSAIGPRDGRDACTALGESEPLREHHRAGSDARWRAPRRRSNGATAIEAEVAAAGLDLGAASTVIDTTDCVRTSTSSTRRPAAAADLPCADREDRRRDGPRDRRSPRRCEERLAAAQAQRAAEEAAAAAAAASAARRRRGRGAGAARGRGGSRRPRERQHRRRRQGDRPADGIGRVRLGLRPVLVPGVALEQGVRLELQGLQLRQRCHGHPAGASRQQDGQRRFGLADAAPRPRSAGACGTSRRSTARPAAPGATRRRPAGTEPGIGRRDGAPAHPAVKRRRRPSSPCRARASRASRAARAGSRRRTPPRAR